jgi:fatty acid desaturase
MFSFLREVRARLRTWWDELGAQRPRAIRDDNRFLTFFRPGDAPELPRVVQRAIAVGALAAILAFGGVALVSLSGLLLSLFVIYLLATEILGLDLEIDPRILQAL